MVNTATDTILSDHATTVCTVNPRSVDDIRQDSGYVRPVDAIPQTLSLALSPIAQGASS
jgi:hypothetical protein